METIRRSMVSQLLQKHPIYWFLNFTWKTPGNDSMTSILSLLIETIVYGCVIIYIVMLLLYWCVILFSIDNPDDMELVNVPHPKYDLRKGTSTWVLRFIFWVFDKVQSPLSHAHLHSGFPRYFSRREESFLDLCFLILPTIVIVLILVPTLGFLYSNECLYNHTTTAFSIDVVGHQWYWSYEYHFNGNDDIFDMAYDSILDVDAVENLNLEVDKRVIIPTDVRISITVTSTDVIHSWAVPQLGIKIDAVPGRLANSMLHSFIIGIFYGQCSELCGVLHGFMPICVESVPLHVFFTWIVIHNSIQEYKI